LLPDELNRVLIFALCRISTGPIADVLPEIMQGACQGVMIE
jgi:hypothetical protein